MVKVERIVCNSSPLIHLAKVNQLRLLQPLYGEVCVPRAVLDEIMAPGKPGVGDLQTLFSEGVLKIEPVQNQALVVLLRKELDRGESEAIALAVELQADLIILDETEARRIADLFKLPKTGFLGILLKAYRAGLLPDVKKVLNEAIQKGFHIHPNLHRRLLSGL